MTDFKKLFIKKEGEAFPQKRLYQGKTIFLVDKFSVSYKEILVFSIESTKSQYVQGFCIGVYDGYVKIEDKPTPKRKYSNVLFWEDSEVLNPKNTKVKVFTKEPCIYLGNIWEEDIPTKRRFIFSENRWETIKLIGVKAACYVGSGQWTKGYCNGAAMYSEDIPGGKRYFCNDGDLDDDFDDIVFTVHRVPSVPKSKKRANPPKPKKNP